MADPGMIVSSFRAGMKRDFARTNMPPESLWNIVDLLPEIIESPARKRGGYSHASSAVSGQSADSGYLTSGIWAPFSAGDALIAFDVDGYPYVFTAAAATAITSAPLPTRSPVFYNNYVIVPHSLGTTAPKKITGITAGSETALGGTPPAGKYAVIYKDVLWLAAPAASGDRIFFSTAGNPEDTWDTTNKYLDASFPITGMAALQNAVFVFGAARTMRVRGSIPPPDSDFIVDDPIFDVGCTDNRSISLYRDKVIWGNGQGLYISDGTALEDLTRVCGMKTWWQDVMAGAEGFTSGSAYSQTAWSIATGVYGDWLVYSIMNGSTEVDSGIIDLTRYTWFRVSNIDAQFFFPRPYPQELYFPRRGAAHPSMRVGGIAQLFYPASANKADADGTNVLPLYETPFGLGDGKLKTIRRVYLTHDTRDAGSDNPTQALSYITSPESTSYTTLGSVAETTEITRKHLALNKAVRGIAFKVAQANASSDTRHYGLGLEAAEREGMK